MKLSIFIVTLTFSDNKFIKIIDDTEEINKLFESKHGYTKEIVNKVKDFYFNECNIEYGTSRLESICHVRSNIKVGKNPKRQIGLILCFMNLFSILFMIKYNYIIYKTVKRMSYPHNILLAYLY